MQIAKLEHQAAPARCASPSGAPRSRACSARRTTSTSLSRTRGRADLANLNFDMVGSPNYVRFVYDGDGSDTPARRPGRLGADRGRCSTTTSPAQGLATEPTAFDGRSDYGPFIDAGIPAGGLFTGAEGIKTPEQAAIYGGTAGEPYDPCYHQACDTIDNLNTKALDEMGDGAAHATLTLAKTKSGFFEDGSKKAARRSASIKARKFNGAARQALGARRASRRTSTGRLRAARRITVPAR